MRILAALSLLSLMPVAIAAEGMWTLDALPKAAMQARYGLVLDAAGVKRIMRASVRLSGGCSGALVSPEGLMMTGYRCVVECAERLSTAERDLFVQGHLAETREEELACPELALDRLEAIEDITARVREATGDLGGKAYADAKARVLADIERDCTASVGEDGRCELVELYHGGLQKLYRYRHYSDLRLVFMPEYQAAMFGGDPDRFNFPRYSFNLALMRVYEGGKPLKLEQWLDLDPDGAAPGEPVMASGHPASTQRLLTVSQLETQRDVVLIARLLYLAELRGLLSRFSAENEAGTRMALSTLDSVERRYKVFSGRLHALLDPEVFERKRRQEAALREFVEADPQRQAQYGGAWDAIARAQTVYRGIATRYEYLEVGRGFLSAYFRFARDLVRSAEERAKPSAQRLREYSDAALPAMQRRLFADVPLHPEFEKLKLSWSLSKLREQLGTGDPFVKLVLGRESPQALAARLVDGTRLGDPTLRKALWEGGAAAIAQSEDPMIQLARAIDPLAREMRARYEDEVHAVVDKNQAEIARARFAQRGTGAYPDASNSLRLSYGEVRGWSEHGQPVAPVTRFDGLYARASGYPPFLLTQRWLLARDVLDPETPFNFVSTLDLVGGSAGSPVIDAQARLVGLVFDGNRQSLGGAYGYEERYNRAIALHSAAIVEGLSKVYGADRLIEEMTGHAP